MNTTMSTAGVRPLPLAKVLLLALAMLLSAGAGELFRPTLRLSEVKARIVLDQQVPQAFGEWRVDPSIIPVVPDPGLQAMLVELYSQTLARTYINAKGERVMLSIAYGSDQGNEATAVHRPEFCYSAQGFRVDVLSKQHVDIGTTRVPTARVLAQIGQRIEPITYWVTLDEAATLPGFGRKLEQIRYGLRGEIPDGMLVRVSNISSNADLAPSFALQQRFLEQLHTALPEAVRTRYFGAAVRS